MPVLSKREEELVSIGAAVGSNCIPCIVFHIKTSKGLGVTNAELAEAIELAEKLKKVPASLVLNAANEEINSVLSAKDEYAKDQHECSC